MGGGLGCTGFGRFVWLQLRQAKQAARSQVYQTLLDRAERVGLNEALDTVRDLGCTTYQEFLRLSPAKQNQVRLVAEFFNEIQHMLPPDARMLKLRYVERLWSQSISTVPTSCGMRARTRGTRTSPTHGG